jgi:hypothetical protein
MNDYNTNTSSKHPSISHVQPSIEEQQKFRTSSNLETQTRCTKRGLLDDVSFWVRNDRTRKITRGAPK